MLLEWILLTSYASINAERTPSSVYYLLKGKKSIQTLQDAHIYKLEAFYGIHRNINQSRFNNKIKQLYSQGMLEKSLKDETNFVTSSRAKEWLHEHPQAIYFNGLKYHEKMDIFINRYLLLVQTLTNTKVGNFSFIPVIDNPNVESWVKNIYLNVRGTEAKILEGIYKEIHAILKELSDKEAGIFVDRMTGYKNYGLSLPQLSDKYKLNEDDIQLTLVSISHQMINKVEEDKVKFPYLSSFIDDVASVTQITKSANETYQLLLKGFPIDAIARIRYLKLNTIYDHIVEIALYNPDFVVDEYVSHNEQQDILRAIKKTNSYKLKDIKQNVSNDISYFQIRLVLAKKNRL